MESEKIFNLQLLVQKQEEELVLYRNGVNIGELLDLIKEKDMEIETTTQLMKSKDETLRKLAKSSNEVLEKYDAAMESKDTLTRDNLRLQDTVSQSTAAIEELKCTCRQKDEKKQELETLISEQTKLIDDMNAALSVQESDISLLKMDVESLGDTLTIKEDAIEKLHQRCAELVAAKNEKIRELDDERAEMVTQVQNFRESVTLGVSKRDAALAKRDAKIADVSGK